MHSMTEGIEDFYPLSPMQAGMLFHTLLSPNTGVYVEQTTCPVTGELNASVFRRAWERVAERHSVLRTFLVWEDLKNPIQMVRRKIEIPLAQYDWRGLPPAERERRLQAFLEEDRLLGIDLSAAPLMRLALFQTANKEYLCLWTRHHTIIDGWSATVVFNEVFAQYKAFSNGGRLEPADAQPYRKYIAWLQKQDLATAEDYWRRVLYGFTTPTPLGVDRRIEVQPAGEKLYGEQGIRLTEQSTAALQSVARRHRLTLNTVVQGAWALVLSRYSGEQDVLFGAVVSGRPAELVGAESMVGLFINTLPVRVQVSPGEVVLSWLTKLQEQQAETRHYEYSPLVEVHGWSLVPRTELLFDTVFIFENYPATDPIHPPSTSNERVRVGEIRTKNQDHYALTVLAAPGRELSLRICYDSRRFDESTITRMLGHWKTGLEGLIAHPEERLANITILTEAERHQLVYEWNETGSECSAQVCVHQLVERQAKLKPKATAVTFRDQEITYGELNARANRLARYLRRLGAGPEVMIGVGMQRSIEWIVTVLAVFKTGGALVSLDPSYPKDRLALMMEDARVPLLLTEERLLAHLPNHEGVTVPIDSQCETIARESDADLQPLATTENACYVVFTSGSTGRPKAAVMNHGSLLNLVLWHHRTCEVTPSDRATQVSRMGFDASMWEMWPYLTIGASLHLLDEETRVSPERLRDWILNNRITIGFLPPVLAESLLDQEWPDDPSLRMLLTGSDKATIHPPESLPFKYVNVYGPTEATVIVTWHLVPCGNGTGGSPLIGRPLDNCEIYLLDQNMDPVPVRVPGELYIGGLHLARGYLNRPDLTAERFIPNPFSRQPGARLYRTGDLARYLPDGNIEFLGRLDFQIKIRGFRIEPGEIETILSQHPEVETALVIPREDVAGDKRLVAYVVPRSKEKHSGSALRSFLQEKLPEYMIPAAFVALDEIPLTPNSKVDRKALPAPDRAGRDFQDALIAPRDALEEQLVRIWQSVLNAEAIGVTDNFFELGGHSILAVRMMAQIHKEFGQSLPLSTLFENATVEALAGLLREHTGPVAWSPLVTIHSQGSRSPFFCAAPIGGQVFGYYDLARHLGREQPFYGLQAPSPADIGNVHARIEDMSDEYIEAIRGVQSEGPYFIGGQSFGGLVAFDIAQRLRQQGQEVALLALLDSWSPVMLEKLPEANDDAMLLALIARTLAREQNKTLLLSPDGLRDFGPEDQLNYFLEQARMAGILGQNIPADIGIPYIRRFVGGFRARLAAARSYVARVYPGHVTLFRATEEDAVSVKELADAGWDIEEPTYGWAQLSSESVEVHFVPGTHETIGQEPNVQVLADLLAAAIEGSKSLLKQ